jgi:cytoskeleton protein RodZ
MGSFGENLRREREMRGVTLEEISAATKISVRFLKSIEDEEFSRLPGGIFNRSFVRAYARYLGLDEDPLLAEYQQAAKDKGEVDLSQFSPPRANTWPEPRSHNALWGGAAAVALLVLGIGLWRHAHRPAHAPAVEQSSVAENSPMARPEGVKPPSPAPAALTSVAANPAAPNPERRATTESTQATPGGVLATPPPANSVPTPRLPLINNDGRLTLQVATTERSWVAIDADGKMIAQGVMEPNTVKTYKADAAFDVLTGNAQGVILTLNGQTMKPLGREGEVKKVHLTWDSLKQNTSH